MRTGNRGVLLNFFILRVRGHFLCYGERLFD
nr:MAG TPA: hypothetical protein [Bacteriophage sp.]DAL68539.1 MAG TPA: hypothetical protein [Bacteriophage sp.]DAQ30400.1 MAG TPA: hypothetical protein [Caudoviricetes sp.]